MSNSDAVEQAINNFEYSVVAYERTPNKYAVGQRNKTRAALIAAVRGEQKRGHVANCECHGETGKHKNPIIDSECLPGLLWDAKVRLEVLESVWATLSLGSMSFDGKLLQTIRNEARSAVEKLEKGK